MTRYFVRMIGTTGIEGERGFSSMSERDEWIIEAQQLGCRVLKTWVGTDEGKDAA